MSESKGSDSGGKLQEKWEKHLERFHARDLDTMFEIHADNMSYFGFIHGTPAPNKIEGKEAFETYMRDRFSQLSADIRFEVNTEAVVDEENTKTVLLRFSLISFFLLSFFSSNRSSAPPPALRWA